METNRISALRNVVNAEPGLGDGADPADAADSPATPAVDFAFLAAQTFDDRDLAREVLALFVDQARRIVPSLPELEPRAQSEAAHLLKGSARAIGAWPAAAAAEAYELTEPAQRAAIQEDLAATFAAAEAAIAAYLRPDETPGRLPAP